MSIRDLSRSICVAALVLTMGLAQASAETLSVGDNAPPLTVSKWVKGEKIDRLEPGQTYVVEFWATWCGPCRVSIPHLTELQKKYKGKGVKVVGVSVWERDPKEVEPFVKEMGDKMDYSVALDDVPEAKGGNEGKMAEAWMKASEANGIPTAFVVRDGKVSWIGHPMEMDEPLAKIVAGDWDLQAAASRYREEKAQQRKLAEMFGKFRKLGPNPDRKELLKLVDAAIAEDPKLERALGMMKFNILMQGDDHDAATAYGEKLVERATKDEAQGLNAIAWTIIDPSSTKKASKADIALALKAAMRANAFTDGENGAILDTLAKAYFDSGEKAKALETQEKAIKQMPEGDKGMKERLEQYRKAVEKK